MAGAVSRIGWLKEYFWHEISQLTSNNPKENNYLKVIRKDKPPISQKVKDISEEDSVSVDEDPPLRVM